MGTAAGSAGLHQACEHVARGPAVLSLGVGDRAVLLPQMKPQLTLVSEVEVTFLTLRKREQSFRITRYLHKKKTVSSPIATVHSTLGLPLRISNY